MLPSSRSPTTVGCGPPHHHSKGRSPVSGDLFASLAVESMAARFRFSVRLELPRQIH
jgi:hypothetical protein